MVGKRVLHLTLYRKWFDLIAAGGKKSEFRDDTPYWHARLFTGGKARVYDEVWFTNGYGKNRPFMRVECRGILWHPGIGLEKSYFEIKLGKVLEVKQ